VIVRSEWCPMAKTARKMKMVQTDNEALPGRQRLQLDFSPEAFDRLQKIREMSDAKTNAEVVRNALRVYEWFLRQRREDYRFHLVKGNTVKEVELVF
jgi:hypothetical protein